MNGVNDSEQRRHPRLKHRAEIRVIIPELSQIFLANLRDLSESGLFLTTKSELPIVVGHILEVQTTEFEGAPIQNVRVVRVLPGEGFAVEFVFG